MADGDPRRRLLARTDAFLERIERLRLQGTLRLPAPLWEEIMQTAVVAGTPRPAVAPSTLAAAHRYLFRLQEVLLSRVPAPPRPAASSPAGSAASLAPLALPSRGRSLTDAEWREQVRLVVQRANDRARYLTAQEQAAARYPDDADLASLRRAQAEQARESAGSLADQAETATGRAPELAPEPVLPATGTLRLENVVIDLDRQEVRQDDGVVPLTMVERTCLVALAAHPGRVLTREAILHLIYRDDPRIEINSQALRVHMCNLRRKLNDPAWLVTVSGIGYRAVTRQPDEMSADSIESIRQRRREQRRAWARSTSGTPAPPPPTPGPTIGRRPGR